MLYLLTDSAPNSSMSASKMSTKLDKPSHPETSNPEPSNPEPSDREAARVTRLTEGDRLAMAEIYEDNGKAIYNYCYRRTGSWHVAEDLTAEVFHELWRCRQSARVVNGKIRPWLYGIASHAINSHHRAQKRERSLVQRAGRVAQTNAEDASPEVDERLDAGRLYQRTLAALSELAPHDQDVFALYFWQELSYDEIAVALSIPIGTVRSRLSRVRRQLRLATHLEELK